MQEMSIGNIVFRIAKIAFEKEKQKIIFFCKKGLTMK